MSNVISLRPAVRIAPAETRSAALLACFAGYRRNDADVFWLKENAELLNVLETSGAQVPQEALEAHRPFYDTVVKRMAFFPQYYRFLLGITLDLEDLGMQGGTGERLVAEAQRQTLPSAEVSDLQRMEARRLFARRGIVALPEDAGLEDRLRAFMARSGTFALPNKKAAYELTHIVFYLSEYGRRDPGLAAEAVTSLHFAGNLAYLDQNSDLLAEICVALRFAGEEPPVLWTEWIRAQTRSFTVECGAGLSLRDDYHDFLVCNWHEAVLGDEPFRKPVEAGGMRFVAGPRAATPLRELSQELFMMEESRSPDWAVIRARIGGRLSESTLDIVDTLAGQSRHFGAFFEGFARVAQA